MGFYPEDEIASLVYVALLSESVLDFSALPH